MPVDEPDQSTNKRPAASLRRSQWGRRAVLAVVIAVPLAGVLAGVAGDLQGTWAETLRDHHRDVRAWVSGAPVVSLLVFACLYFIGVTFSLPGAVWMSLMAGYLFGPWVGGAAVLVAATGGALAVFVLARFGFAEEKLSKALQSGPLRKSQGLRARLQSHAFWVLLGVRLIPIFPFWLVNLLAAAVGMSVRTYVLATCIGIMPAALLYTAMGAGLGDLLESGGTPDLAMIWQPHIVLPLLGLAALSALPAVVPSLRRWLSGQDIGQAGVNPAADPRDGEAQPADPSPPSPHSKKHPPNEVSDG